MILVRNIKLFSARDMINEIEKELKRTREDNFEVTDIIPSDVCSIEVDDLGKVSIYVPGDFDYFRFDVEDFIRREYQYQVIDSVFERDVFILRPRFPMKTKEVLNIIRYIIKESDFCSIIKQY